MGEKVIVIAALLVSLPPTSFTFPTEQHKPQNASTTDTHEPKYTVPIYQSVNSKTEEALINQQSENIRHIIAAEQRNHEQREKQEESKQVKKEKSIVSVEDERFPTLEELRLKCQHFSRLFGLSHSDNIFMENMANSDNVERFGSTVAPPRPITEISRRPVFIRNKPAFLQRNNEGFYVTATPLGNEVSTTKRPLWVSSTSYPKVVYEYTSRSTTTTQAPSTTTRTTTPYVTTSKTNDFSDATSSTATDRPKIGIKYTKFEPVILQKTILTDGRVMYHWHKSLPTAPVDILAPAAPLATPIMQSPRYEYAPVPGSVPLASHRYLGPAASSTVEPSTSSSTTTEKSSWLFVPFSSLFGGSHEEETTTAESTATTTTATPSTHEQNINTKSNPPHSTTEGIKPAQLKVVVPVHYDNIDASLAPQNNNRLDYYRKPAVEAVAPPHSVQVMKPLGVPQNMPRYTLAYTGTGYGLTFNNGIPYGGAYGPEYMNYQAAVPLHREIKKLDEVSVFPILSRTKKRKEWR